MHQLGRTYQIEGFGKQGSIGLNWGIVRVDE